MAAYTPPAGNAVALDLAGAYAAAAGNAADLALGPSTAHQRASSWRILAGGSLDTAWRLWGGGAQASTWRLVARGSIASSWGILGTAWQQAAQASAWRILARGTRDSAWEVHAWPPILPGVYLVVGSGWARQEKRRAEPAAPFGDPPPRRPSVACFWGEGDHRRAEPSDAWIDSTRERHGVGMPWGEPGQHPRAEPSAPWIRAPSRTRRAAALWAAAVPLAAEREAAHGDPARRRLGSAIAWETAQRRRWETLAAVRDPARRRLPFVFPWDQSHLVRWEERWWKEGQTLFRWHCEGLGSAVYEPAFGGAVPLDLRCRLLDWPGYAVWLTLREAPCPEAVRRRSWILMNTVTVVRLPDLAPVPVLGLSLATDYDSWAWGLSLTLPDRSTLALVSPEGGTPRELQITINGHVWTALVEAFDERREFGKTGFTVTGRSRSAYLSAPFASAHSHVEAEARNAVQLAEAALGATGWALTWDTVDWLVPAGAWAYQGRTPMEAVGAIAASVGARVQSDPALDVLRILPRYPVSPWAWAQAIPDATVTDNLLRSLALRWEERPSWNGVYVSGQAQGCLVSVTREGTAGDLQASLIVDPLVTHVDAGRERGRNVLAEGGRRATVSVELPLLAGAPGLLTPGMLVEVQDGITTWRGLVTATRIETGRPSVRQVVDLERRYL